MAVVYFRPQARNVEALKALRVSVCKPLPVDEIAKLYGLVPATVRVCQLPDQSLSLSAIRRLMPDLGTEVRPFIICGYFGPFPAGFKAAFLDMHGQQASLEVVQQLFMSASTGVYSVIREGDSSQEQLVLKLLYEQTVMFPAERPTLEELEKLRSSTGRRCPSLPAMVWYGWFIASGNMMTDFGDSGGLVLKPVGVCVKGMLFSQQQQLCKAAFDILLALYHLYLLERRHRDVKPENIVYVEAQAQFVLVDFKSAHEEAYKEKEDEVHDCVSLVLSLAEMAGWKCTGGYLAAAITIASVHPVLGEFALYASTLQSSRSFPEYRHWLHKLATACGVDAATAIELLDGPKAETEDAPCRGVRHLWLVSE
ncbi:hypothetical protein SELMODRAFT_414376 [Selaginella moellendorffii]|uniref:Protein kinase domain-containing protein n=1 Tax=Selaginella moellendorffii TaxID=88036 RepID=D8RSJ3_SELML|nr:hypothetical protein SELMODRAFT_414376 [Selaginella moellendorffii]